MKSFFNSGICIILAVFLLPVKVYGATNFSGKWRWALYADSVDELPPAYRHLPLKKVPEYSLDVEIFQKGDKIHGHSSSTYNFQSRTDTDDFVGKVNGSATTFTIHSGHGGKILVKLSKEEKHLHWKIVKQQGEHFFPKDVLLSK